jgi:hypothetical protein
MLREGKVLRIVDHESLADDAVLTRGGMRVFSLSKHPFDLLKGYMGSPSVGSERLMPGAAIMEAGAELAKFCGVSSFAATLWYMDPRTWMSMG